MHNPDVSCLQKQPQANLSQIPNSTESSIVPIHKDTALDSSSAYQGSWHTFSFTFPVPVEEVRIGFDPSELGIFGNADRHSNSSLNAMSQIDNCADDNATPQGTSGTKSNTTTSAYTCNNTNKSQSQTPFQPSSSGTTSSALTSSNCRSSSATQQQQHTVQLYIRTEGDAVASCDYRLTRATSSVHINAADAGPQSGTSLIMPFTGCYGDKAMQDMEREIRNYSMHVNFKGNSFNAVTDFMKNNTTFTGTTKTPDSSVNLNLTTPFASSTNYLNSLNNAGGIPNAAVATDWLKSLTNTFPNNNMVGGADLGLAGSAGNLLQFPVATQSHLMAGARSGQQTGYGQQLLGNVTQSIGPSNILNGANTNSAFSRHPHSGPFHSNETGPSNNNPFLLSGNQMQQSMSATSQPNSAPTSTPKAKRARRPANNNNLANNTTTTNNNNNNLMNLSTMQPNMSRMYSSNPPNNMASMLTAVSCGGLPTMVPPQQHQHMLQLQQQQNSMGGNTAASSPTSSVYSRGSNASNNVCSICSMQFNRPSNLQRHILLIHSRDMSQSTLDLSSSPIQQAQQHNNTNSSRQVNPIPGGNIPQQQQPSLFSMQQPQTPEASGRRVMASKVCPLCRVMKCRQYKQLIEHVQRHHNIPLQIDALDFETMSDFLSWKQQLEVASGASFAQKCGMSEVKDSINSYFACNRTGKFMSKSIHIGPLPGGSGSSIRDNSSIVSSGSGSIRIGATCTAFIRTARCKGTGRIKATFCATHLGH